MVCVEGVIYSINVLVNNPGSINQEYQFSVYPPTIFLTPHYTYSCAFLFNFFLSLGNTTSFRNIFSYPAVINILNTLGICLTFNSRLWTPVEARQNLVEYSTHIGINLTHRNLLISKLQNLKCHIFLGFFQSPNCIERQSVVNSYSPHFWKKNIWVFKLTPSDFVNYLLHNTINSKSTPPHITSAKSIEGMSSNCVNYTGASRRFYNFTKGRYSNNRQNVISSFYCALYITIAILFAMVLSLCNNVFVFGHFWTEIFLFFLYFAYLMCT